MSTTMYSHLDLRISDRKIISCNHISPTNGYEALTPADGENYYENVYCTHITLANAQAACDQYKIGGYCSKCGYVYKSKLTNLLYQQLSNNVTGKPDNLTAIQPDLADLFSADFWDDNNRYAYFLKNLAISLYYKYYNELNGAMFSLKHHGTQKLNPNLIKHLHKFYLTLYFD